MHPTLRKIRKRLGKPDLYFGLREAAKRMPSSRNGDGGIVVGVTSSREGEGKTFVSLTLALQAVDAGDQRVLLIDGNAGGRRSASKIMDSEDIVPDREAAMGVPTHVGKLDLLSLEAESEAMSSGSADGLVALTQQAATTYALTILDLPSLSEAGRVFDLLRCADGVLFVVEHRRFSVTQIRNHASDLPHIGVGVFGTVLNKRRYPVPGFLYNSL